MSTTTCQDDGKGTDGSETRCGGGVSGQPVRASSSELVRASVSLYSRLVFYPCSLYQPLQCRANSLLVLHVSSLRPPPTIPSAPCQCVQAEKRKLLIELC